MRKEFYFIKGIRYLHGGYAEDCVDYCELTDFTQDRPHDHYMIYSFQLISTNV